MCETSRPGENGPRAGEATSGDRQRAWRRRRPRRPLAPDRGSNVNQRGHTVADTAGPAVAGCRSGRQACTGRPRRPARVRLCRPGAATSHRTATRRSDVRGPRSVVVVVLVLFLVVVVVVELVVDVAAGGAGRRTERG